MGTTNNRMAVIAAGLALGAIGGFNPLDIGTDERRHYIPQGRPGAPKARVERKKRNKAAAKSRAKNRGR